MNRSIGIISCGAEKLGTASKACELYVGRYSQSNLQAAVAEFGIENVYILSAKYGLVSADQVIEPYEMKMGDKGSVGVETIKSQVESLGLSDCDVYVLGPKAYHNILWVAGSEMDWFPMHVYEADLGIGYQAKAAKVIKDIK